MGRTILFSMLIFFSFSAFAQQDINQTDAQGHKQGFWQKRDSAGKLLYEGMFKNDRPVGEMKRYHPNGVVKAILVFSEKSDSALVQIFDKEGKLTAKGWYIGQKKEGEWSNYTGRRLVSTENYTNGIKNGISKRFYQTGELLDETNWLDNVEEGLYRAYDKSGKKYIECMYKNGKRNGWYVSLYPNGEMEMEACYKNNLRDSTWKYYDEKGQLRYTLKYDKGILITPEILDSIQKIQFDELERNKGRMIDPEKYMADPEQYILKGRN